MDHSGFSNGCFTVEFKDRVLWLSEHLQDFSEVFGSELALYILVRIRYIESLAILLVVHVG